MPLHKPARFYTVWALNATLGAEGKALDIVRYVSQIRVTLGRFLAADVRPAAWYTSAPYGTPDLAPS